ncbi:hypothetical protein VTO73DRAFT_14310 [Trametes versicolor]
MGSGNGHARERRGEEEEERMGPQLHNPPSSAYAPPRGFCTTRPAPIPLISSRIRPFNLGPSIAHHPRVSVLLPPPPASRTPSRCARPPADFQNDARAAIRSQRTLGPSTSRRRPPSGDRPLWATRRWTRNAAAFRPWSTLGPEPWRGSDEVYTRAIVGVHTLTILFVRTSQVFVPRLHAEGE